MNIEVLFSEQAPIPSHAIAALLALGIGILQLKKNKGTSLHKVIGYTWIGLMFYVSLSSFFIHKLRILSIFSPIHLLSIFTIGSLIYAILMVRKGEIEKHSKMMTLLFYLGLVLMGAFTLLPNRIMYTVIFS